MKKFILLASIVLSAFISQAQCAANFSYSVSGNTVQLTNLSSGTFNYNWHFGDGSSSQAFNPSHTYAVAGTYDICLYAYYSDSLGGFCADTICQLVTVQDSTINTPCSADFSYTMSGNTVYFNNASSGTNGNQWSFGDGGSSTSTNPTHTYASAGTYWVCLYSYYDDSLQVTCGDSVCYQITVQDSTINTPCSADFTYTTSGNTVYFNNASSGTNGNQWYFGDGTTSTSTNPTHTYSSPGAYWVCLYSYYDDSLQVTCSDSVCYLVTVQDSTINTPCSADFTYTVSGNTVVFNNTSSGTNGNQWYFGDGTTSASTNPTHTYSSPGAYWVCLYSYYDDSLQVTCSDSVCYLVTVQDSTINTPCSADFTYTTSGNTVYFNNASSGTNGNQWYFGDGTTSTSTNPTHTYSSPGAYWVCLYSYYDDSLQVTCSDSVCYLVTVQDSTINTPCSANFTYTVSGNSVVFNNTSSGTMYYTWYFGDGSTSQSFNPSHTYAAAGTYDVCLFAYYSDSLGNNCQDTLCQLITVQDSLANLNSVSMNAFQLFPNPTSTVLNVKLDKETANAYASIIDLVGREMIRQDLTTDLTEISVVDLPSGVYMIRLLDAKNQLIGMRKFIRQ